jgi:hypothetical protein
VAQNPLKKARKSLFEKSLEHKNRSTHRGETRGTDEEPPPLHAHMSEKQPNNQSAEKKNAWSKVPGGRVGHTRGFLAELLFFILFPDPILVNIG